MDSKIPFNKDNGTKISFSELVKLIRRIKNINTSFCWHSKTELVAAIIID